MKEEDQPQANRTYALYPSEASQLLWALRIGMSAVRKAEDWALGEEETEGLEQDMEQMDKAYEQLVSAIRRGNKGWTERRVCGNCRHCQVSWDGSDRPEEYWCELREAVWEDSDEESEGPIIVDLDSDACKDIRSILQQEVGE